MDFHDDGNNFRGFSYKGMPITTLRSDNTTYLSIRVDYLNNEFTYNEWMNANEYKLCNAFNGVHEFDIDELIENLEKIIAKVAEMNEAAKNEEIDVTLIKKTLENEIIYAEQVVKNFKNNFKWYEATPYEINGFIEYLKCQEREIELAKQTNFDVLERREIKQYIERLNKYGYVRVKKDGYFLSLMLNALRTKTK